LIHHGTLLREGECKRLKAREQSTGHKAEVVAMHSLRVSVRWTVSSEA
jgi:hypothetical protein